MQGIRFYLPVWMAVLITGVAIDLQAGVENGALLQGNLLEGGKNVMTSDQPMEVTWNVKASVDPTAFEHSFNDPTRLLVKRDGDYLVPSPRCSGFPRAEIGGFFVQHRGGERRHLSRSAFMV